MADALYNAILGVEPSKNATPSSAQKPAPTTGADIDIPDSVLDSLRRVESDKDRFALNKQSKAMGPYQFIPETVQMLHKQGYKFNPFDEAESRAMAKTYLQTLSKKAGSLEGGLAAYGGHITKDPAPYVNKVLGGASHTESKPQAQSSNDPLYNAILGGTAEEKTPTAPAAKSGFPEEDLSKPVTFNRKLARQGEKMREQGSKLQPFVQEVAKPLEEITAEDYAKNSTPAIVAKLNFGTDKQKQEALDTIYAGSEKLVKGVADFANAPNKGEIIKNALSSIVENPGRFVGESVKSTIYHPEQIYIGNVAGKVTGDIAEKAIGGVKKGAQAVAETPAYQGLASKAKTAKEVMQESFDAYKQTQAPKTAPVAVETVPIAEPSLVGVGAAKTEINPYAGKITGEETARGQYPTVKLSKVKEDAPTVEQATRAEIANEVLGDTGQVRSGVLTGNENTLRQEYTEARSANPTPKSELLKKQIADEQNALTRYAEKRVEATGASKNLPSDYERGQLMNDAIASSEGLTGFFKQAKEGLYNEARLKVGDNPVASHTLENLLNSSKFKSELKLKGIKDFTEGLDELLQLHKTQGFEGTKPGSIAGLEELRKSVNQQWTPQNKREIGRIVKAIDEDIAKAGGEDLYKRARSVHQAEQKIFESKGMDKLFGEVDSNGVQTATDFQAIPKKLNQMPADQWKHIYDTYDEISKGRVRGVGFDLELTPELMQYAEAAKAEMRGALAREIYQAGAGKAGVWNQNSVNNILNARAKKIEHAFSPEEQRAFHTLNYAGHIMPGVHAYEGAALQAQRVNKFAEKFPMIGREAGAMTHIPGLSTIGEKIGEKAAVYTINKAERKKATKLQEEMMKNAQKGKTKLKDIGKE